MKNPTFILKIPYTAYKKANEMGILKEFIFYYRLKSIRIDGYFKRGKVIPQIQAKISASQATIRRNISRLSELGFLSIEKGNISLRGYDQVWSILGFDKESINNKSIRLARINPENLINEIYINEIAFNLRKQRYEIARKRKEQGHRIKVDTDNVMNIYRYNSSAPTLSCKSVAKLFGYQSASKGCYIEKNLAMNGLLIINKKLEVILKNVSKSYFLTLNLKGNCFFQKGKILKQLPNQLIPISC